MPCLRLPDKKKRGKKKKTTQESYWSRIASITSYNKSYHPRKHPAIILKKKGSIFCVHAVKLQYFQEGKSEGKLHQHQNSVNRSPIPANPVGVQRKATPASVFQARSNFPKDQKAFVSRNLVQPITEDRQLPSGIVT